MQYIGSSFNSLLTGHSMFQIFLNNWWNARPVWICLLWEGSIYQQLYSPQWWFRLITAGWDTSPLLILSSLQYEKLKYWGQHTFASLNWMATRIMAHSQRVLPCYCSTGQWGGMVTNWGGGRRKNSGSILLMSLSMCLEVILVHCSKVRATLAMCWCHMESNVSTSLATWFYCQCGFLPLVSPLAWQP